MSQSDVQMSTHSSCFNPVCVKCRCDLRFAISGIGHLETDVRAHPVLQFVETGALVVALSDTFPFEQPRRFAFQVFHHVEESVAGKVKPGLSANGFVHLARNGPPRGGGHRRWWRTGGRSAPQNQGLLQNRFGSCSLLLSWLFHQRFQSVEGLVPLLGDLIE